jgi:hypothetical protein
MVPMCSKLPKPRTPIQEPQYLDLVELQMRFESVMESAGLGTNLAMDMKKSEMAVRDLNTLVSSLSVIILTIKLTSPQVKLSNLVSKDQLAMSLDAFVASAREASQQLSRLDSRVRGAVDS